MQAKTVHFFYFCELGTFHTDVLRLLCTRSVLCSGAVFCNCVVYDTTAVPFKVVHHTYIAIYIAIRN